MLEPARKGEAKNLQTIFKQLHAIPIHNYPTIPSEGIPDRHGRTHGHCNPGLWIRIKLEYELGGYLHLDKDMEKHLREQAQRTGCK